MKPLLFSLIFSLSALFSFSQSTAQVTFQVDMNNVTSSFTTPEVNGTFNSWCGNCWAMSDSNGDNIWDIVGTIDINTDYEFKFSADGWGIQENLLPGSPCTVTNFGFTNRILNVSGDTILPIVCWESCSDCSSGASSYNVTFEVDMRNVTDTYTNPEVNGDFNGWCGSCWAMSDSNNDSIWEFATTLAAGDSIEFKYSADNWNIQEDLDSNLSCITINYDPSAPNGWGYVNRVAVVNSDTVFSSPWNACGISGCADPSAINYNPLATTNDGSCVYCYYGCMDILSCNFDSLATCDDGSCLNIYGCTDSLACNFDSLATCDDGSCLNIYGCTDTNACNYDTLATCDDGSCQTTYGCTDTNACNYDALATCDDGSCQTTYGCTDTNACNYDALATCDDGGCQIIYGCTNANACNYDALATCDDGSCQIAYGCTDTNSCNYDALANCDDGSCLNIYGCTSQGAMNYDSLANCDDGSCLFSSLGCMDSTAINYNPLATFDDSSCVYCYYGCTDTNACNYDALATCDDGSCQTTYGCTDTNACNYDALAKCDDGSCQTTYGCTDSNACNYDALAKCDDGSCQTTYGCTDSNACNYNALATCDDGSCQITYGCTDTNACNYDALATCDDGSCQITYGCTDSNACNYDALATCDDGSCLNVYGCTDTLANNYDPLATCEDSSCVYGYSVTFQLDLRNVTSISYTAPEINGMFNSWCGNCVQLEDLNNDSIWEITILLDSGSYEYKYSADDFAIAENLFSGDSCTVSNFGFTNRLITVSKDTILDPVCWELCSDCDAGPSSYNVTFRLDMSEYIGPPFSTPEVNGTFNGWCGSCWAMEDPDGDNIWEFTALLAAGDSIEYKYSADSWNIQEELDTNLSSSCIITNYDPQAPNGFAYVNRWGVVNSETTLDIVCWNDCIECQGQTGIEESFYKEILVYPNPSTGSFYIKSGSIIKKIVIYNSLGETVFVKESLAAFEGYNLSIAKNGLYFISILNGDQIINRKILIQN